LSRDLVIERIATADRWDGIRTNDQDRGDDDFNPGRIHDGPLRPAAVLVPLVDRADGLTILLTVRTEALARHAGQISFPGGRTDPGDPHPEATALREAEEEIGLARRHVEIIGRLDNYFVRTGFLVTPVVGLVTPPFEITPDGNEVAEVFEVPLSFIMNPNNHERGEMMYRGAPRRFHAMPYGEHYIWGATAGMLRNLYELLTG
jgi:8-oxo-dGTP pyrophosphatase MutT (NUDIX family)